MKIEKNFYTIYVNIENINLKKYWCADLRTLKKTKTGICSATKLEKEKKNISQFRTIKGDKKRGKNLIISSEKKES